MELTEVTKKIISQFVGERFFVVNSLGELDRINAFGQARRWAFKSAKQANNVATRQGSKVFDKQLNKFI